MEASKVHIVRAAVRKVVADRCAEATQYNPRFREAAEFWKAAAIYELALGLKALASEMEISGRRADASS